MGDLPAGIYQTNAFEPTLVFALPDGFSQYFPDDDDEIALGGPGVDLNITRPSQVIDPETRAAADTPEDLHAWFLDHPSYDSPVPQSMTIAGIAASYIDLPAVSADVQLFHYPSGDMHIPPGIALRVYVVPLDGPDLVLLMLPGGGEAFAEAAATTQPIVESLDIPH
jgi:hypothetical protein